MYFKVSGSSKKVHLHPSALVNYEMAIHIGHDSVNLNLSRFDGIEGVIYIQVQSGLNLSVGRIKDPFI